VLSFWVSMVRVNQSCEGTATVAGLINLLSAHPRQIGPPGGTLFSVHGPAQCQLGAGGAARFLPTCCLAIRHMCNDVRAPDDGAELCLGSGGRARFAQGGTWRLWQSGCSRPLGRGVRLILWCGGAPPNPLVSMPNLESASRPPMALWPIDRAHAENGLSR